jgi:hypothetical protein
MRIAQLELTAQQIRQGGCFGVLLEETGERVPVRIQPRQVHHGAKLRGPDGLVVYIRKKGRR